MALRQRLTVPPKSLPDSVKTLRISIDLDDKSDLPRLVKALREYRRLIPPEELVIAEESETGFHLLILLKEPVPLRYALALRLLLLDDPMHVLYDLYSSLYTPSFPTGVLFTEKRYTRKPKFYREVFRGSLSQFLKLHQ